VITENGKPALDTLTFGKFTITQLDVVSAFYVARTATLKYADFVLADATSGFTMPGFNSTFGQIGFYDGSNSVFGTNYQNDLNQHLVSAVATASATVHVDGVSEASGTSSSVSVDALFDGRSAGNINFEGKAQEIVLWTTDQSTNRPAIEGNINAHFQIGNFPNPTSGLLATYTGAAAAYSVRQLANTAALSMRVREDATDTETNIGFDANGDLDTAAIAAHCGTANGYVVNWFDQAGSQNDATQSTLASQPQIYNGTAVITKNGKPALQYDGTSNFFNVPSTQWTNGQMMASVVLTGTTVDDTYWVDSNNTTFRMFNGGSEHKFIAWPLTPIVITKGSSMATGQLLVTGRIGTTSEGYTLYENGSSVANAASYTGSMPTTSLTAYIGQNNNNTQRYGGRMQELIHWSNNQTSNRSGIETDINTYFSIY
jgi:hypothetical protein